MFPATTMHEAAASTAASPEEEAGEAADDVPSWLFLMAAIKT